jgi:hypothetical protein
VSPDRGRLNESSSERASVTKSKEEAMRINWTTLHVDDQERALQFTDMNLPHGLRSLASRPH